MPTQCPLFLSFLRLDVRSDQELVREPIGNAALTLLEEVRIDVKGDRGTGMAEAMLHLGDRSARCNQAEAQL